MNATAESSGVRLLQKISFPEISTPTVRERALVDIDLEHATPPTDLEAISPGLNIGGNPFLRFAESINAG